MIKSSFSKFFSCLLFFSFITPFQNTYADIEAPQSVGAPLIETIVTAQDKALQTRILSQIEIFSILLHKIGVRAKNLELSTEQHTKLREEFSEMQENLKTIKARNSLQVERNQLARLTILLNALIKATEKSLHQSLKVMPELDPKTLKRSPKDFKPEELEDLLKESEKCLKGFDKLITNLDKTIVNRTYSWISDRWNTPVYSITSLGGESNKDIYISSILKRMFTYSAGLGLIVRNLPHKQVASIPNDYLRGWIQKLKGFVGDAGWTEQTSKTEQAHPVDFIDADSENYLGNVAGNAHKLKSDKNGMPVVTQIKNGKTEPVQLIIENGHYNLKEDHFSLLERTEGFFTGLVKSQKPTKLYLHLAGSGDSKIEFNSFDNLLKNIFYNGKAFQIPSGGYIAEWANNTFVDLSTGKSIILSENDFNKKIPLHRGAVTGSKFAWFDPSTGEKIAVDKDLIINKEHFNFTTSIESTRKNEQQSSGGFINDLFGNIRWLIQPELASISFQLPIAKYVATQIYDDFQTICKDSPQVAALIHNKLRGEREELVGNYLVPKETFDDVVGREEIKSQLRPIIDFVSNPQSYIQSGIKIPRGYLLAGEPQTGKTLMVKALGGELSKVIRETQGTGKEVKVFPIEVHRLIRDGIGPWMNLLRQCAPCILFCDEFDLTGAQRSENKLFLAEALTALSGYTTSSDLQDLVIFVIATNRPENIDYAIINPGRCGNVLYFENPYFKDRKDYFIRFFNDRVINTDAFDLDEIAQETEACSYATLQSIGHGILSLAEKHNQIPCHRHAQEVLDNVVRKIIYEGDGISDTKREIMAARYGAKAFASVILNPDKKFVAATLLKITKEIEEKPVLHHYDVVNDKDTSGIQFGGVFSYNQSDTYGLISNEELIKECKVTLAGTVGQRILNLDYTNYPEDEMEALKIARRLMFYGCDERLFPRKIREEKSIEAYLLVEKCRQEMYNLLEQHKANFEKLVDLLQHRKVIRTSDIKQCFGLDDLDLVRDYFSQKTTQETSVSLEELKKEFLEQTEQDTELDLLEEEEEEQEEKDLKRTARKEQEQAYQNKRRKEFEQKENEEQDHEHDDNCQH